MATLVTRTSKGSPLSNTEVDTNFTNLNTELATKVSLANPVFTTAATIPTSSSFQITSNTISQVKPTLQLDFLNSTKLDSRISFSRASIATRVNPQGLIETVAANTPRFDYDPVTKSPLGFLVESARTNAILNSGNPAVTHQITVTGGSGTFQNGEIVTATDGGTGQYDSTNSSATIFAVMNGTGTLTGTLTGSNSAATRTISNTVRIRNLTNLTTTPFADTAPDGTQTATKLVENPITSLRGISVIISNNFTINLYYTVSIYAKAAERAQFILGGGVNTAFNPSQYGKFDLNTGVASILTGTPTVSITDVGNGWYRCTVVMQASATSTSNIDLQILDDTGTNEYTGVSGSGLLIWGPQLETGEGSTSYIPTTTAQVTRALDLATMNSVVPWYNQTEGTIFAQFRAGSGVPTALQPILQLEDLASNTSSIYLARSAGTSPRARAVSRTPLLATDMDITLGSGVQIANYTATRMALGIALNNYRVSHKGILNTTDTAVLTPVITRMTLGWFTFSVNRLNGHLQCIRYYPKRLTDTEIQALTT